MKKLLICILFSFSMILYGQQLINVGASPNDKTGDPLRTAFQKVNSNLTAIYDSLDNKAPLIGTASGLTAGGIVRMARTPLSYFNFYSISTDPINVSHYYGEDGFYIFPKVGTYLHNYLDTTYLGTGTVKFLNGNLGYTTGRLGKGWFTDLEVTNAIAGSITGNAATVTGFSRGTYSNSLALATTGGDAYILTLTMRGADQNITMPNAAAATLGAVYSDTMSVSAGVLRIKATTITTEPYSVQIFSSTGKDITHAVSDSVALNGGVYKLYVYSVDALSGAKIKIIY